MLRGLISYPSSSNINSGHLPLIGIVSNKFKESRYAEIQKEVLQWTLPKV